MGIALSCFDSSARRGWVVISMLHSHYCQERDPKPISRRMGGPHVLAGFEPRTIQPVASCCAQGRIYARANGARAQGGKFQGAAY
jgi:hypothetical protein